MARLFCPVCGKNVEKLYAGMCKECYRRSHPLVKNPSKPIDVVVCPICGSYQIGKKWYNPKRQGDFKEILLKTLSKKLEINGSIENIIISDDSFAHILNIKKGALIIDVEGKALPEFSIYKEEYAIPVKIVFKLCPKCIDIKSKREMAKVQIRARNRSFTYDETEKIERIMSETLTELYKNDKSAVPIDVKIKENAIDYIFSSQKVARTIALRLKKSLGAEFLETFKDAGISERGKKLGKITYRLLLPEFRKGDIIDFNGNKYYIIDILGKQLRVLSLSDYSLRSLVLTKSLIDSVNIVEKRESIKYALVLSISPPYIQIMYLDKSYSVREIWLPKIPKWIEEGKKIGYTIIDEDIFLLPIKKFSLNRFIR